MTDPIRDLLEEAGRVAMDSWRTGDVGVMDKGGRGERPNLVTDADLAVNALITDRLASLFPRVSIVSEEAEGYDSAPPDAFVLDPIDGTHNFLAGSPLWTIVLARTRGHEVEEAWVYHPPTRELSHASRLTPTTHAGRPVVVSGTASRRGLISISLSRELLPLLMAADRFAGIRALGSSAYCLAAAARGEFLLHAGGGHPWDVAAGFLLIERAGGLVRTLSGGRRSPYENVKSLAGAPHAVEQSLSLF